MIIPHQGLNSTKWYACAYESSTSSTPVMASKPKATKLNGVNGSLIILIAVGAKCKFWDTLVE